jgi:hypothetical protein
MFVGALIGALFIVHNLVVVPLAFALGVAAIIAVAAAGLGKPDSPWATT